MLFNPRNPLLKRLLPLTVRLITVNQVPHNLIVCLLLVRMDGFNFELECLLSRFESFLPGFQSLKAFSLCLLAILYIGNISL